MPRLLFPLLLLAALRAAAGPEELIAAERAFAAAAAHSGLRAAFAQFTPADAILFRPRPVTREAYFATAAEETGRLEWAPAYARLARSGDAGFTTGPYQYRLDPTNAAVHATGHFVTLWRRTGEGWRAVLDLAVPGPIEGFPSVADADGREDPDEPIVGWRRDARSRDLRHWEENFTRYLTRQGEAAALGEFAHRRLRVVRAGRPPLAGRRPAAETLPAARPGTRDVRLGLFIADGGDLGWAWGETEALVSGPGQPAKVGGWVRVWRRTGWSGTWRVALDVRVDYGVP
ncbi:MAG TPA: DUF4440 domain-containing protein [Verrucomicrobiota bacterium]|nr:DUF4440 domain-containing protein [Verrucomicrobiota bacterium]